MVQCLMKGCDALIFQKEDKMNKSIVSIGLKCKNHKYYIEEQPL